MLNMPQQIGISTYFDELFLRIFEVACAQGKRSPAIEIVYYLPGADRHLASEPLSAFNARPDYIGEAEGAFIETEYGDVGFGSRSNLAEFGMLYLGRWIGG